MRFWIGVVSRNHVLNGIKGGFAQVCHGKKGPLAQMKKGDCLIYYSPREVMGGGAFCKRFTAIGQVKTGEVYPFEMSPSFRPYRLDIDYFSSIEAPIEPLLSKLDFSRGGQNWGLMMRRGLFEISEHDFMVISEAMEVAFEDEKEFPSRHDAPSDSPGFLLWRVSNLWQKGQREALSGLNLTHAQFVILACIHFLGVQGREPTQKEIADLAATDPMMTSQIVRHLEKEKLVVRKQKDGRSFSVGATEKGKELVKKAIPVVEGVDAEFFSPIGAAQGVLCSQLDELTKS